MAPADENNHDTQPAVPMIKEDKMDIFALLRNIRLFSALTDQELRQIRDKVAIKRFRKNEVILYEENTNQVMYIILSGKVKVLQTSEDGKEMILAMHHAGDFFGEVSLIDSLTMPASVVATDDSTVAIISKKDFYTILHSQGKVVDDLLLIMCSRLRESWQKMQILSLNNAAQKVRMLFLMLSQEHGRKTGEGLMLDIKLTHQDIANMVGITRETVTRILDRWLVNEEIRVIKKKFMLLSSDFLKSDLGREVMQ
ncbi:MAG: Crp/Fnr family transcriptional regulator [Thermodesulfovibrio sp.]|nr:Crp/Fnr family transcriptional regulator [Thermodesulfovibrio sp.]